MAEIQQCRVAELFDDPRCEELIAEYAAECGNALIGKPAPRRDLYESLEASGLGQCFAAYEGGMLCGFAMVIASVVPHYGLSCATTESLFVERGSHSGAELMRAIEDYARAAGCTAFFYTAPLNSRMARLLFLCADEYANTNHVFCKRLV
jgi:hypothetical protein